MEDGEAGRRVRPFGDGAVVAEVDSVSAAHGLAAALEAGPAWTGVEDVVVGYRSVTVVADPGVADLAAMGEELARIPTRVRDPAKTRRVGDPCRLRRSRPRRGGRRSGWSPATVVEQLTRADLVVAFLGFLPGFAYLEGLPPVLAEIPRRSSPRPAVGAGSLGIGGGFAGIYPQASPGGWQLLGHTGFALFDPESPPFATLSPGDTVRLRAVEDPGAVSTRARPPLRSEAARSAVVEAPGFLSMVEDLGRVGVARLGVPRAGAADPFALRVANRLVGNDEGAAALEITALGPRLRFDSAAHVAVVGRAEVTLDGRTVEPDTVFPVEAGPGALGRKDARRPSVLSLDRGRARRRPRIRQPLLGRADRPGPGPLHAGDVLGIGSPTRPRGRMMRTPGQGAPITCCGWYRDPTSSEPAPPTAWRRHRGRWGRTATGWGSVCSETTPLDTPTSGVASRGMVTGAVQVPPDGQPVALLCDHATVGGYPVVATVVRADLGVLGRCRPGDAVHFEPVDLAEADRARAGAERSLDRAVVGWYPVRSD